MPSLRARLETLCEINRRLATFTSLDELLAYATAQARELFQAEGCAVLLVDTAGREFRFPVASQRTGTAASSEQLRDLHFPADQGIAGWVLKNRQSAVVDDVQNDPRFYRGVDASTGMVTRRIFCAPLRTNGGTIGVIEVLNARGASDDGTVPFLEALASDIAVAHERAAFSVALQQEASGLRRIGLLAGVALLVLGLTVVAAACVAHAARALPANELLAEPGVLLGAAVAAAGIVVTLAVRRVARTT